MKNIRIRKWSGYVRAAGRGRVAAGGALLLVVLAACCWRGGGTARGRATLPTTPRNVAHLLADFATHAKLHPHLEEWTVEEESGNYSSWRYSVSYRCGARCTGRARVTALDAPAAPPAHPPAHLPAHRVRVEHHSCTTLPLLTFLRFCEDWETESVVRPEGAGGAVLEVVVRARCGWGAGGAGGPCAASLQDYLKQHLQQLQHVLAP